MTLEEAIVHCEDLAMVLEVECNHECADEHRQLAEWLRELKERREQEPYKAEKEES